MTSPMLCSTKSNRLGGRWLRGLLIGALAVLSLVAIAPTALAIELSGGRLRGELHGMPTDAAVERLAELLGARLRWLSPAAADVVQVRLTGLTVEQGLARVLGKRSYLLMLGARPEIHVLGDTAEEPRERSEHEPPPLTEEKEELEQLRAVAALDQIAHADAESEDVAAELDSLVRGEADSTLRLAAAERLLGLDPEQAASALAWLTTDADPAVQQRAEALLAVVQPDRLAALTD